MYEVIIIGSGFGGLAAAIKIREFGIENILILERDKELGGTWWCNRYPGAAVDVQSHLYSLSFEPYDWTRLFAHRDELLAYTNHVITKYGLRKKSKVNSNVSELRYSEEESYWTVTTKEGNSYSAKFVVNASGPLSQPNIPIIEGQHSFEGASMHTNRWDHSVDYTGKRIAVIGTGASAIQVIPELAKSAEQLYVFQRTPHWIIKRPDRKLYEWERRLMKIGWINRLVRKSMYWAFESRMIGFRYSQKFLKFQGEREAFKHLKNQIPNEEFRKFVIPDYAIGCKRILLNNDYYPALQRPNVTLLTKESGVEQITTNGIRTMDGREIEVDMIVYATGFHAAENMIVYPVYGKNGKELCEEWKDGAYAYLGTMVSDFPNLFLLAGPNTGIGHTSAIFMLETQLIYIIKMLKAAHEKGIKSLEVKRNVESDYNNWIQEELAKTVWQKGGCKSWYQRADGKNTTLYPNFTFIFRRACRNVKLEDHIIG